MHWKPADDDVVLCLPQSIATRILYIFIKTSIISTKTIETSFVSRTRWKVEALGIAQHYGEVVWNHSAATSFKFCILYAANELWHSK